MRKRKMKMYETYVNGRIYRSSRKSDLKRLQRKYKLFKFVPYKNRVGRFIGDQYTFYVTYDNIKRIR